MFEKAESEYQTLTEKKRIVNNDKAKIEKVIVIDRNHIASLFSNLQKKQANDHGIWKTA